MTKKLLHYFLLSLVIYLFSFLFVINYFTTNIYGQYDPSDPSGSYGDPGAGDGSDANPGDANVDGGNGISGSAGGNPNDNPNPIDVTGQPVHFAISYFCNGPFFHLTWSQQTNAVYEIKRDGVALAGSPFPNAVLAYDDGQINVFATYTYTIRWLDASTGVQNAIVSLLVNAPCAPPSVPNPVLSYACFGVTPKITISWAQTTNTTHYEVWRSPTGNEFGADGILLSPANYTPLGFLDPDNSVVVGQNPQRNFVYYYKVVAVGPGYPDGRTPSAYKRIDIGNCVADVSYVDPLKACYTPATWIAAPPQPVKSSASDPSGIISVTYKLSNVNNAALFKEFVATNTTPGLNPSNWQYSFNGTNDLGSVALGGVNNTYKLEVKARNGNGVESPYGYAQEFNYAANCTRAWLKTTGGDVHSNGEINTPGGP